MPGPLYNTLLYGTESLCGFSVSVPWEGGVLASSASAAINSERINFRIMLLTSLWIWPLVALLTVVSSKYGGNNARGKNVTPFLDLGQSWASFIFCVTTS